MLYPLLARALAFGDAGLVPATLLLVNLAAVALGTLALAALLRRRGASPWWALLFAGYPGIYLAVGHDLSEPLAYALVAGGLYALDRTGVAWPVPAALLFGLAGIARETSLVFPVALAACVALGLGERGREPRRWRAAALLAGVSLAPYLAVRLGVAAVYGVWLDNGARELSLAPFANYVGAWRDDEALALLLLSVVIPAVLALVVVAYAARALTPAVVLVGANALVLVGMAPVGSLADYLAAGRIATGVVVAFIAALPAVRSSRARRLAWLPVAFWLVPWLVIDSLAKET